MESERDFANLVHEFQHEITKAQNNLQLFDKIQNLINAAKNEMGNDTQNLTRQSVHSLRNIMSKFNSDVDMVFAEFDKYGADGERCSIDMQQRKGDNRCRITHIVDAEKCICYAIDINGEVMAKLKMFWKEAPFQELHCNEMLGMDDVFGIDIDSILNRAKFVFDTTMNSVRVRLIDTGEIIDMERHFSLQKLPDDIKSLPAAAFLCKINQIRGAEVHSLPNSLKDLIFEYRIRGTDENNGMFHIDIYSTNPFLVGFSDDMDWKMCNKFDSDSGLWVNANAVACADEVADAYANEMTGADIDDDINWNLERTENEALQHKWNNLGNATKKSLISSSIYNSNYDLNDNNTLNGFQSVENRNAMASMRGLPIDVNDDDDGASGGGATGGALEPIQSTNRNDEKSISIKNRSNADLRTASMSNVRSTIYKRQTNIIDSSRACRNDRRRHHSNTLFESVQPMKTQCKTTVVQSHHSKLKIPRVGEQITIIPTYVLNAREFYGQLGSNFQALHYSQRQLNYRQLHFENEQYSQSAVPGEAELVLVLLENGFFHRAKVLNGSNSQEIMVFLLDYGTTHLVELRHVYKWTPKCDKMAFCAILFTLANVQCPDPCEPSVVEYATEKIPKTFTTAEMISYDDRSMSVRIFDDSGFDIGDEINCFSA